MIAPNFNYIFTIYNREPMRNSELFVSTQCEFLKIPYLGAPPNIRALAEDKHLTKHMARSVGVSTAPWCVYSLGCNLNSADAVPDFSGPYFIKPRFGAASDGIAEDSICDTWAMAKEKIAGFLAERTEVIMEKCISGVDLTVPVLGGMNPVILPCMKETSELIHGIATHKQKRLLNGGRQRTTCDDEMINSTVHRFVSTMCREIGSFDYARFDFRIEAGTGKVYLLEFNIACNLGSHAAITAAASKMDVTQEQVVEHVVAHSIRRQRR